MNYLNIVVFWLRNAKPIKTHPKIKLKAFWFHFLTQTKHARRCLYKTVKFGIFSQIYIERLRKDFKAWKNLEILKLGGDWDELWTTIFLDNLVQNILGKVKLDEIGQDKQTLILFLIFVSKLFLIFCYFDICVILDH